MIKVLHVSDIHMGSGLSHGRTNPETGLNTRLEDFRKALSTCLDRALAEPVDLVLFGGDAFPDATPPPYIQEAFAGEFRRLVAANIPTILLVGNHDQHAQGKGGASLSIYRTLGVPGFIVGDKIETHRINTPNGEVQVITLPWLTYSALLTRPETEGLSLSDVNQLLLTKLQPILEAEIRRLDPNLPTVLLGHLMADRAELGAERFLAVGKGFTIPLSFLIRSEFDYVALGHVHRHQNLNPKGEPPVIYPGSIERVDFSEEKEEKGYVLIHLAKGKTQWEFCPLSVRPFLTIDVDVTKKEEPQKVIESAIARQKIPDAVVRLKYKLRSEQLDQIETRTLQNALQFAHSYTISPELVSQLARPRVPELSEQVSLDPMSALKTYLGNRDDLEEMSEEMLEAAEQLLTGQVQEESAEVASTKEQLNLLQ
ncbi:MAG: exonuclease subunit SbcD [Cyanobacteria bacterium]|jgi:exonuclease SbcD|nr:exonuclease subunit SbcD [Cyanobacteria bacterium GSL.Bin1]